MASGSAPSSGKITAPSQKGVDAPGGNFAILLSVDSDESFQSTAACTAASIAAGGLFRFPLSEEVAQYP